MTTYKKDAGSKSDILFTVSLCLFTAILINNTFERIAIEMMQFICYPATIIRLCVYPETGLQAFTRKNSHPGYCRVSASGCELFIRAV